MDSLQWPSWETWVSSFQIHRHKTRVFSGSGVHADHSGFDTPQTATLLHTNIISTFAGAGKGQASGESTTCVGLCWPSCRRKGGRILLLKKKAAQKSVCMSKCRLLTPPPETAVCLTTNTDTLWEDKHDWSCLTSDWGTVTHSTFVKHFVAALCCRWWEDRPGFTRVSVHRLTVQSPQLNTLATTFQSSNVIVNTQISTQGSFFIASWFVSFGLFYWANNVFDIYTTSVLMAVVAECLYLTDDETVPFHIKMARLQKGMQMNCEAESTSQRSWPEVQEFLKSKNKTYVDVY